MEETKNDSALAAIKYVVENHLIDALEFLDCWYHGDFEICRREWADIPDEVFIGADPLFQKSNKE